ncbi:recombinase family protein [Waterburya agarophytonicola K14]|uniref:Recombinase family protein n=1 Tax=Waterburya agarophytonicola KI4 TaxID=2874699 RepID=A0A964FH70_9CYAN|nr:recombinase family protein [Waterburya agarophytonicola]MCC0177208.1 recombinase family protein [Waterburya agarophytonicola KI4]
MTFSLDSACFYYRVSTSNQSERASTLSHYQSRARKIGFKDEQIFYDIGSGTTAERSSYKKVKEMAIKGQINAIFLPNDLSRLTRNLVEFQVIKALLLETGVKLYNLSFDEYKFESPEEGLQGNLQISFYQYEAERNKRRAIDGAKYIRENHIPQRAIFPYEKDGNKLVPNHDFYMDTKTSFWQIANDIVDTYIVTHSHRGTIHQMLEKYGTTDTKVRHLKYPTEASGIRRFLRRQEIRGNLHYKVTDEIIYGTHDPLVFGSRLITLDKLLNRPVKGWNPNKKRRNLWKNIMFCGECKSEMRVQSNCGKYRYVLCSNANPKAAKVITRRKLRQEICRCSQVGYSGLTPDDLEFQTIEALTRRARVIANKVYDDPVIVTPKEVPDLQRQIETLKNTAMTVPGLEGVIREKEQELQKLLYLDNTKDILETQAQREKLAEFGQTMEFWQRASFDQKLRLFAEFISRIDIRDGVPTFTFKV